MRDHTVHLDLSMGMKDSRQEGRALLERTLAEVAQGTCVEIEGVDRTTAP